MSSMLELMWADMDKGFGEIEKQIAALRKDVRQSLAARRWCEECRHLHRKASEEPCNECEPGTRSGWEKP